MRLRCFVFLLALLIFLPAVLQAQGGRDLSIVGTVRLHQGRQPDTAVQVYLYSTVNTLLEQTSTDSSGSYTFPRVRPGSFRVVARLHGYLEASAEVVVYPRSSRTMVAPLLLSPLSPEQAGAASGILDASEFRLSKESRALFEKGMRALEKGRLSEAERHLARLVEVEPQFAKGHHFLGVSLTLRASYSAADAHFRRAIELSPANADSYFSLGRSLNLQNRPAEAMTPLKMGLVIAPSSSFGLFEKSRALFLLRDYAAAESVAREAVALRPPPPPEIHLILANSCMNQGRLADAAQELEKYLKLDPGSSSAPKAREVLSKIKSSPSFSSSSGSSQRP